MRPNDTINITRTTTRDRTLPLQENEFRALLAGTLQAWGEQTGQALDELADRIAMAPEDQSFLGTFTTIGAMMTDEEANVPEGWECPVCGQDEMDLIFPNGDEYECSCGVVYSDNMEAGRPAWYRQDGVTRYYVAIAKTYVSIPVAS